MGSLASLVTEIGKMPPKEALFCKIFALSHVLLPFLKIAQETIHLRLCCGLTSC